MPQFPGSITDTQADAIINALHSWICVTRVAVADVETGKSTIAAIVCDAVHEDITLQPLHDAYGRKFYPARWPAK